MKTTEEKVKAAKNPAEAMLAIAVSIDRIEKRMASIDESLAKGVLDSISGDGGWGEWSSDEPEESGVHNPGAVQATGEVGEDGAELGILADRLPPPKIEMKTNEETGEQELVIPEPDDDTFKARMAFAKDVLNLDVAWQDLPGESALKAYAKGGPIWLFHVDPELMSQYDPSIQSLMLRDIEPEYPREAYDIAREIMKDPSAERPSLGT